MIVHCIVSKSFCWFSYDFRRSRLYKWTQKVRCLWKQSGDKERVWGGESRRATIAEETGEGGVPWLLWKQHDGGEQRWELRRRGGGGKGETNSAIKIASYLWTDAGASSAITTGTSLPTFVRLTKQTENTCETMNEIVKYLKNTTSKGKA